MRRVGETVPMEEAKRRALEFLGERKYVKPSEVARAIWPGVVFRSQGAAGAAGRILRVLQREGKARWRCTWSGDRERSWGWERISTE